MDAAGGRTDRRSVTPVKYAGAATARPRPDNGQGPGFGSMLRFWRTSFALSQEELAERAGISPRHVSFLENGRTRAGKDVTHGLARALGLGAHDTATFLLAAGHAPSPLALAATPAADLDDTLALLLRQADPEPACVFAPCGRIRLVNKAWVAAHRRHLGAIAEGDDLNALMLFLHEDGWRRFVPGWRDVASLLLTALQQEALVGQNAAASRTLRSILALPGIPVDWARRGAALSEQGPDFRVEMQFGTGRSRRFRLLHNMVGTYPFAGGARLFVQHVFADDGKAALLPDDLKGLGAVSHPLGPY